MRNRSIYISDDNVAEWEAFCEICELQNISVSAKIAELIRAYLKIQKRSTK